MRKKLFLSIHQMSTMVNVRIILLSKISNLEDNSKKHLNQMISYIVKSVLQTVDSLILILIQITI